MIQEMMNMPASKAQQKAVNKYMRENYDRIALLVAKGDREKIKAHAEKLGESLNAFLNRAVKETIDSDMKKAGHHLSDRLAKVLLEYVNNCRLLRGCYVIFEKWLYC